MNPVVPKTFQELVSILARRGDHLGLVELQREGDEQWGCGALAEKARQIAAGLSAEGLAPGQRVVLFAPNSPGWVVACLGVLEAGAVPVPVDSQAVGADLAHILANSKPSWAFTVERLAPRLQESSGDNTLRLVLLDGDEEAEPHLTHLLRTPGDCGTGVDAGQEAVLFYTSGTSGAPKGVPLTHSNLLSNLRAIVAEEIVGPEDRLLLPLPLHHVYPFAVGLLAPLVLGMPLVLPYSLTGPQLARAMHEGNVTAILGIPRLYAALFSAIEQGPARGGKAAVGVFKAILRLSILLQRRAGLGAGKRIFAPLRRRLGPRLRLLISGGSALDPHLAWCLDGLGWEVTTGYGLTETSPILSFNPSGARRFETAGRALAGVELRIAAPEGRGGVGEVQARGPNVFGGYLDLPDNTAAAFSDDGWFRTGDLGQLDPDGWLHLSGRASARIVLPGGENVDPERLEERLEASSLVREAGALEYAGDLAALLVPEPEARRRYQDEALKERLRAEVATMLRHVPSYERPTNLQLDGAALPRTRLGKLRRHQLEERFRGIVEGRRTAPEAGLADPEELGPDDRQLLEDPTASRVWAWLGEHFAEERIVPDSDLRVDLGVDSLEWVSLTIDLQRHTGVVLEEEAIARIETVRDLLRESAVASGAGSEGQDLEERLRQPREILDSDQQDWLEPPQGATRLLGGSLRPLARWAMQDLFRLRVSGLEHLPRDGPCVLAPNHLSALDPVVILSVLGPERAPRTCWGGWTGLLFQRPWTRVISRAIRVLPVDPRKGPLSSLAFGAAALERGCILVWFSEGKRSEDGELQAFRPGIGTLARVWSAPLIPARISGTREALAPGSLRLRLRPIELRLGSPVEPAELEERGTGDNPAERIANALRDRVRDLGRR
jgi:long-chain acyl-CoA synthetase